MKASKGEERIIEILRRGGYKFEREKRFKDLKGGLLRFDFYVDCAPAPKAIIEFQGEGHYYPIPKFHKTRTDFESARERDRRKISYCLANGIPIYCIPYWELDNIKSASDIFKPKYRAYDRWKNDKDWAKFQSL